MLIVISRHLVANDLLREGSMKDWGKTRIIASVIAMIGQVTHHKLGMDFLRPA